MTEFNKPGPPPWIEDSFCTKLGDRYVLGPVFSNKHPNIYWGYDTKLKKRVLIKKDSQKNDFFTSGNTQHEARFPHLSNAGDEFTITHNCVAFIDLIDKNQTHYLVMEYLNPELYTSLSKFMEVTQTPMLAVALMSALARELKAWSDHGFYHRDLNPGNIFFASLVYGYHVVFVDFATSLTADLFEANKNALMAESQKAVVGVLEYIPPEFFVSPSLSLQPPEYSLVWILGNMLWNLLQKEREIESDSGLTMLLGDNRLYLQNLNEFGVELEKVEFVLAKATSNNSTERYQGIHAFVAAIEDLVAGISNTLDSQPQKRDNPITDKPTVQITV